MAHFIYAGQAAWQLIEEWDGPGASTNATRTRDYVYGNSIDELVHSRDLTGTTPVEWHHHQDDLFSIVATTDSTGAVVERHQYGDYGDRRVFDAAGNTREYSLIGLRHGFTGQLHDDESGLVLMRHRHLNPRDGKWLQRDPAWYVDGASLSAAFISNTPSGLDPFGLDWHHMLPFDLFDQETGDNKDSVPSDVDPHSSEYGVELDSKKHTELHKKGWNDEWKEFFVDNKNPTKKQIDDKLKELRNDPRFKDILDCAKTVDAPYPPSRINQRRAAKLAKKAGGWSLGRLARGAGKIVARLAAPVVALLSIPTVVEGVQAGDPALQIAADVVLPVSTDDLQSGIDAVNESWDKFEDEKREDIYGPQDTNNTGGERPLPGE